jgi:gliding motility-associated-like protein
MKQVNMLLCLIVLHFGGIQAQTIKRQVIGSSGTNFVQVQGTNILVSSTVAQPPNAGTVISPIGCLRQGFQQPPNQEDLCPIAISFDIDTMTISGCGSYYTFEYTGSVTPNTVISWNFGPNGFPEIVDGQLASNIGFDQSGLQLITITVSNGDCQKTVTTTLNADKPPFFVQTLTQNPFCFGSSGTINLVPSNGTPPYLVKWSNGAVTEDLINVGPGIYTYTISDQRGCSMTSDVLLTGSDEPLIIQPIILDELCFETNDGLIELNILNGAQPILFQWADGSTDAIRTDLDSGFYAVQITDAFGCVIDTSFKIGTFCAQTETDFIPDTFSPNGDASNETWDIPILDRFPNHTVKIYNRWGSIIWSSKGNYTPWAGTNDQGEQLPIGAYYYAIELNDTQSRVYKGSVTLIR